MPSDDRTAAAASRGALPARRLLPSALVGLAVLASLAGCPTVDLGEDPPDPGSCRPSPEYFREVIWPEYLAPAEAARSCVDAAACHRRADGRSALRLATDPVDHSANYQVVIRFLNCGSPDASPLLTKPLSRIDPHGGGDQFDPNDPAVELFLDWFAD